MTSAATAKILLFIALSMGPIHRPSTILATSQSENYAFSQGGGGWELKTKGLPTDEWTTREKVRTPSGDDFRAISHHWESGDISLDLADGSRILRQRGALFYIQAPGGPNQRVYTILFPQETK